ncbi:hypothetical protein SAMN05421766_106203, partial [Zobellia uliginosa]
GNPGNVSISEGNAINLNVDDADADATNEIQDLSLTGNILKVTNNAGATDIDLTPYTNTDTQDLSIDASGKTISLVEGGSVTVNTDDADADATNEIQDLSLTGNILKVTNNAGATDIDLTPYTNTDTQDLSIDASGKTISLVEGGSVTVNTDDADADATNEIQDLSLTGNILKVTNNAGATDIDLTPYTNTDTQDLSIDASGKTISLVEGGSVTVNTDDADADATNEIQDLSLTGNILKVTNNAGATDIDLTPYTNTDTQDLSIDASGKTISLVEGGSVTVNTDDADADATNEIQDLEDVIGEDPSAGNQAITNLADPNNPQDAATKAYVDALDTDDADADPNNEIQELTSTDGSVILTQTGDDYNLEVNFPDNDDNSATNELTDLSLASDILTLTNPATPANQVDLSPYLDNTDNQQISLSGNIITLANGTGADTTVDLTDFRDDQNLSSAVVTANESVEIRINDGTNTTIDIRDADADPTNELTDLALTGSTLTLTNPATSGNSIDLSSLSDHDWYEVGGTSAPDAITDNIFTEGNVAIGKTTITNNRALDVEGNIELTDYVYMNGKQALRANDSWLRINPSTNATTGFTSGTLINGHLRADDTLTVNESGGDNDMRVEGDTDSNLIRTDALNDRVGIGTGSPDAKLDVENGTVRFSDYGSLAITGTPTSLIGVEADGDLIEVDANSLGSDNQTLTAGAAAGSISISGGNSAIINVDDADSNPTNEIQTLTSTDGSVTLSESGGDYDLEVNFPANNDNSATNELSDLALTGSTLTLTNPATSGNSVDLSGLADNLGDHTATENIQTAGNWISNDGGNEGIQVGTDGNIGVNTSSLANARITAVGGNDLPGLYLTGEDNIWFDAGQVRITTHDGAGNWQIKSGADNDDVALGSTGAVKMRIDEIGTWSVYSQNGLTAGDAIGWNLGLYQSGLGNVGIGGVDTSGNKLHVYGNTRTENFQMTSGATNGHILQSDAAGNASWVNPTAVFTDTDDQTLSLTGSSLTISEGNSVDLSTLTDHDWYEVGGTSAPDAITDNIFTEGNVAIGKTSITGSRALDVEGNVELNDYLYMNGKNTLRSTDGWLRINWSNHYTLGTYFNGNVKMYNGLVVNEIGGNFDMRVEGDTDRYLLFADASADEVGIGTSSPDAKLDVEGGTVRFSDYGSNAVSGNATSLIGVEADGDLVEVNSLKASKVFYPPSIEVDASTNGTGRTINLHDQYIAQFGSPMVASTSAPSAIPTYANNELYYYVTYYDTAVFANVSVDEFGVMTYDVIAQPASYNSLINVVFVVK